MFPRLLNAISHSLQEQALLTLLACNHHTQAYGLTLSPDDARQLLAAREQALRHYGRVELGVGAAQMLVETFVASPYMEADSFAETLAELLDLFYAVKNETEDRIGDTQLLDEMKARFDGECGGAMELLRGSMEHYASGFRSGLLLIDEASEGADE